ncbi:MAG TPA: hypothetical protein VHE23_06220 [Candidatus Acidoferrales bacterium]|nr:hypothetical protein [Candidatus Acidoferrales bacterium]
MKKLWLAVAVGILGVIAGSAPVWGQAHAPLQYRGGPVLRTFKIYPLYYGNWSAAEITAQQNYLNGLTGYLSGNGKPAGQQPMMWQYGVNDASVAPAVTASPGATPVKLTRSDLLNIIHTNQTSGKLPAFGPATLIMVFPAHGFGLDNCNGCGYHSSESASSFWSVVPHDVGPNLPLVTAHEVFEASIDPADDNDPGWDESVDGCSSIVNLPFGQIPGAADNTNNGTCSTTGYTSTDEIQVYGWKYADYRKKYDELWPQGWRLYILQSYVTNNEVLYNAVWRRWIGDEIQVYSWQFADFKKKYDEQFPQNWRLYILQSYVANGQVLYNAVWRKGSLGEHQTYDTTYTNYRSQYDNLWTQKWRLQTLESYVAGSQVAYNAVWRPGDSGEFQVYGWTYTDYRKRYDDLWQQGWRLYSLQAYVNNGQTLYNAVWRPGSMPEIQVYGYKYADYRKKYDELWPQGWRLYVLDSFVTGDGQVLYNAVWRIGTTDRPL